MLSASLSLLVYCAARCRCEWAQERTRARLAAETAYPDTKTNEPLALARAAARRVSSLSPFARRVRARRLRAIEEQLAELVGFLAAALRASLSIRQALAEAAEQLPPPLAEEIKIVAHELSLGASLDEVLQAMADRVGLEDARLLAAALTITSETGGNLPHTLDTLAATVRERLRLRREIAVLTTQGRYSGLILSVLPVGVLCLLAITAPLDLLRFVATPAGTVVLASGSALNGVGFLAIRRITAIEV